jgi:hypothetical protein
MKVDVIYAIGRHRQRAGRHGRHISRPDRLPQLRRPGRLGLVASLAKPGGNVTGLAQQSYDQSAKSLQFLAEATGKLTSVAYWMGAETRSLPYVAGPCATAISAATALGIKIQLVDVDSFDDVRADGPATRSIRVNDGVVSSYAF